MCCLRVILMDVSDYVFGLRNCLVFVVEVRVEIN